MSIGALEMSCEINGAGSLNGELSAATTTDGGDGL